MKRSGFVRKTPLRATGTSARLTIKLTKRVCRGCKQKFMQERFNQVVCSGDCGKLFAEEKREKEVRLAAKAQRAIDAAQKKLATPVKVLLKQAEAIVNAYARARDRYLGCCSCDKPSSWDGTWHASHFKSVGSNSVLRFNLWNINKSCSECNWFKSGNITEYEKRLVLKIGAPRVEWLKCQNGVKTYTAEYLVRLKKVISKRTKRLLARQERTQ